MGPTTEGHPCPPAGIAMLQVSNASDWGFRCARSVAALTATPVPPMGLSVPTDMSVPTELGTGRTYVVQRGDTALSIARRFGITVQQLQVANNSDPDRIYPGQTLVIP